MDIKNTHATFYIYVLYISTESRTAHILFQ